MEVKKIDDTQITNAIDLIWQTFLQFEAPDYSEEGVKSFQDFIENKEIVKTLEFWGAYDEEELEGGDKRTVLRFHPAIAPVKIGVLPLSKKLNEGAEKIYTELSKYFNCEFDDRGNIGKRYRRQDEIGTPFCITYDFDSEEDHAVTVRDRDTMEQVRIPISGLKDYFADKFMF